MQGYFSPDCYRPLRSNAPPLTTSQSLSPHLTPRLRILNRLLKRESELRRINSDAVLRFHVVIGARRITRVGRGAIEDAVHDLRESGARAEDLLLWVAAVGRLCVDDEGVSVVIFELR